MKVTVDTDYLYNTGDLDKIWVKTTISKIEEILTNGIIMMLVICLMVMLSEISYQAGLYHRPLKNSYIFVPTTDSALNWTQYYSFADIHPDSVIKILKSSLKEKRK